MDERVEGTVSYGKTVHTNLQWSLVQIHTNTYMCIHIYTKSFYFLSPLYIRSFIIAFCCYHSCVVQLVAPHTRRIKFNYTIQQKNENHISLCVPSVPNQQQLSLFCCFVRTFALASSSFTQFSYIPPLAL